jgi:CDP-diacylglycerol--serine O-phosphatidyltransferase
MTDLFPAFEPDPYESRKRRFKPIPLRLIVPNVITLLALCLGLTAIRFALEGRLEFAAYAVLGAAIFDGLDGRIARMIKGTSRFGAELDSLADFVSFGVAPAVILYTFSLHSLKSLGWVAALVFACAAALRLARFNIMIDDPARPEWTKAFFTGMPAPAGALTALLPLYASILGLPVNWYVAPFVALYLMGIAFLMVSTIPTFSGKNAGTRVPRTYVLPLFVLAVMFTALLASFTFEMLTIIAVVYLGTIPLSFLRHKTLKQEHERSMSLVPPLDNEPLREESAKDMSKSGLSDT